MSQTQTVKFNFRLPHSSPSTMMVSVVEGAREMASSLQRLERRASVSSISPGRDLKEDNHRSRVAYMLKLIQPNLYYLLKDYMNTGTKWSMFRPSICLPFFLTPIGIKSFARLPFVFVPPFPPASHTFFVSNAAKKHLDLVSKTSVLEKTGCL